MMRPQKYGQQGFTLVELTAVIAIIALILGGVLLGRHMVRATQLNSVLSDKAAYEAAISHFRAKYDALPGDFKEAETYWGTDPNGCPTGTLGSTTKTSATCNGDGNGLIGDTTAARYSEWYRAWQQLSAAGMIKDNFTGVAGTGSAVYSVIGQNVPASRIKGAGFTLRYLGYFPAALGFFTADYGTMLHFGAEYSGTVSLNPVITTEEALSLDLKADDGLPASGNIITFQNTSAWSGGCASTDVASTAVYDTTQKGIKCALSLILNL